MPLTLIDSISGSNETFNAVTFVEDGQDSYFNLSNTYGNEIRVDYIPIVDSSWGKENFDVFLFDNPYLNAENDVFELYEESIDERIGWIFPLTILVSNDNDYSETKNLNKYKFVAQSILLNGTQIFNQKNNGDSYSIADIYNDASIICILNKQTISKIADFNFNDYLLSFYKFGYSVFQETSIRKKILEKADFVQQMRNPERRRVFIKKSRFDITSNNYTDSLFKKYLLKTDDFLVRFIFLYQVIEQLMEEEFNLLFHQYLTDYTSKTITKNDFKEYIITSSKERDLIKSVFNKTVIDGYLRSDFDGAFNFLYAEMNYKTKNSLPDKIYDFRNLVTHSYRNVIEKVEFVNNLIQIFEEILVCALINYNSTMIIPATI